MPRRFDEDLGGLRRRDQGRALRGHGAARPALEIARFRTTGATTVSLADYVAATEAEPDGDLLSDRRGCGQRRASPQLEGYKARDVEVLLLTDPVDSFWVRTALGFDGKPFKSVTQGDDDLDAMPLEATPEDRRDRRADGAALGTLIAAVQAGARRCGQGRAHPARLTDSPVCLVADDQVSTARLNAC